MTVPQLPPDSLADRVVRFFQTSPDEVLSTDDIAAKFGTSVRGIHTQLACTLVSEVLLRERNDDGDYTYAAGPSIFVAQAPPAKAKPQAAQERKRTVAKTQAPPPAKAKPQEAPFTPANVKIVKDVPLPGRWNVPNDWDQLLGRMQVGDSTEPLPRKIEANVRKHITRVHAQGKGTYAVRRIDASGQIGIWRIA
ncbi:hypothetical protein D5039_21975 [Verminephrobacter aporrectodeae subsp. tuberculatae]|uniref:Uncharacterized protein n=1 Tax=Verminephrobacter aporrectodeae subsp. tuberculatae TaxID=1110392 RepID=A0ABT3KZJ5_9BURK|nr:hypothetical protein [Verminephrobacter aporrectodeae]MCW5323711.1 hypothetical protein [Verminephrobacter aporrectodeae subsp. tuberculatae]